MASYRELDATGCDRPRFVLMAKQCLAAHWEVAKRKPEASKP